MDTRVVPDTLPLNRGGCTWYQSSDDNSAFHGRIELAVDTFSILQMPTRDSELGFRRQVRSEWPERVCKQRYTRDGDQSLVSRESHDPAIRDLHKISMYRTRLSFFVMQVR